MSAPRVLMLFALTLLVGAAIYLGVRGMGQNATSPLPDLRFESFVRSTPMFPEIGSAAQFNAVIANRGAGDFTGGVEVVVFEEAPRKGGQPRRFASARFEGTIAADSTATLDVPFQAPAKPDTLELYFAIDPDGEHREQSRENNVVMTPIDIVAPPEPIADLKFSELRFDPPAPVAGQAVAIVAVVTNQGDAPTQSPIGVDIYVNDPIGPRPRLPGEHRLTAPPLGPGESAEVQVRTLFESPQLLGVFGQVDTDQLIDESDTTNNVEGPLIVSVSTANQSGNPDLVIKEMSIDPPTPVAGTTGTLRISIENRGGADTTAGFSVNVKHGPRGGRGPGFPPEEDDEPSWSRDLRFLAAGQSYDLPPIRVMFQRAGDWDAKAEIDPYEEVGEGDREDNNGMEITAHVSQPR